MTRYIDADKIRWADHYDSDGNLSKYKVAYSDEMPPAVDAVPVVRCEDCKNFGTDGNRLNCNVFCCSMPENGFCSIGERKEE